MNCPFNKRTKFLIACAIIGIALSFSLKAGFCEKPFWKEMWRIGEPLASGIVVSEVSDGGGEKSRIVLRNIKQQNPYSISASTFQDSPFGLLTAPPQPGYLLDLGVHWMATGIRFASWEDIERKQGVYDFAAVDKKLTYLSRNGINTIIELRAINPVYGTRSGKRGFLGYSYPEQHLTEWARFVEKLVERYDADGFEDAPGSPRVTEYQLIHELPVPQLRQGFWRKNPDIYAKFFKVTYDAVRRSCTDCTLYFVGGFAQDFLFRGEEIRSMEVADEDGFFVKVLNEFREKSIKLKNIGFDYHFWSFWLFNQNVTAESYRNHVWFVEKIKKFSKYFGYSDSEIKIISKEAGVNGYLNKEREQAIYLLKIYISAIAAGQKRLFWTSVVEYGHEAKLFLGMGLVHNPKNNGYSHKKISYYTYQLMADKLKDSDWTNVKSVVNGKDSVYVFKFPQKKESKTVYIVWWDYFSEKERERKDYRFRSDFTSDKITVTCALPRGKSGLEIQDMVHFESEIHEIKEGIVAVNLGKEPVYIEEGPIPAPVYRVKRVNPAILDTLVD